MLLEEVANPVLQMSENDHEALEAPMFQATNLLFQYRNAVHLGETLGCFMGQWLEATADAGGEQQCRPYRVSGLVNAQGLIVFHFGDTPLPRLALFGLEV